MRVSVRTGDTAGQRERGGDACAKAQPNLLMDGRRVVLSLLTSTGAGREM